MALATTDIDILTAANAGRDGQSSQGGVPAGPVEILPLEEAISIAGAEWRALERRVPSATFFQSMAWAAAVLAWRQGVPDKASQRDCTVLITRGRDGRLSGLWPIQIEQHMGASFAVGLGDPFNQYNDILVDPEADPTSVLASMLAALRALGTVSGVILRKVRNDAACAGAIAAQGTVMATTAAPSVDLAPFVDFQAYHRTVKSKTRKNLRNARNRLERAGGELVHVVHERTEAVADAVERAFVLRSAWLEREGISSRAFLDAGFARFVRQLGSAQTSCGSTGDGGEMRLVAFELRQGNEMLSIQWGFIDKRRYYAFIAARNPAFDAQSPGRLHLEDVIRSCSRREIDVVDFLAPDVDYKRTWATDIVPVIDYGIAFTAYGKLVLGGAFGAPRRLAKQTFDRLPRRLRYAAIHILARHHP